MLVKIINRWRSPKNKKKSRKRKALSKEQQSQRRRMSPKMLKMLGGPMISATVSLSISEIMVIRKRAQETRASFGGYIRRLVEEAIHS